MHQTIYYITICNFAYGSQETHNDINNNLMSDIVMSNASHIVTEVWKEKGIGGRRVILQFSQTSAQEDANVSKEISQIMEELMMKSISKRNGGNQDG